MKYLDFWKLWWRNIRFNYMLIKILWIELTNVLLYLRIIVILIFMLIFQIFAFYSERWSECETSILNLLFGISSILKLPNGQGDFDIEQLINIWDRCSGKITDIFIIFFQSGITPQFLQCYQVFLLLAFPIFRFANAVWKIQCFSET